MSEYLRARGHWCGTGAVPNLNIAATAKSIDPTAPGGVGASALVLGALGLVGYLIYRHFKKNKGTPPKGQ